MINNTFLINCTNPVDYLNSLQEIGNKKSKLWNGFEIMTNTPMLKQIAKFSSKTMTSLSGWLTIVRQGKLKFLTGLTRFTGLVVENPVNLVNPVKETL